MTSDARTSARVGKALAAGFAAAVPTLVAPEVALAAGDVVVAATVSGVTGAALGALVGGGVGYALYRRDHRELERVIMDLAGTDGDRTSSTPAPDTREMSAPVAGPASVAAPGTGAGSGAMAVAETTAAPVAGSADGPASDPKPEADPEVSESGLIDALPKESLRVGEPSARRAAPASRPRDLGFLPDPLAMDTPVATQGARSGHADVAPGHGFVASAPQGTPGSYVPSTSNPYLAGEPHVAPASRPKAMGPRAEARPSDYEELALDYVARKGLRERMTSTARGVAAVVGERMGRNKMDGVPVIARADGSVGDVGTSWWERDERVQRSPEPPRMAATDLAAESSMVSYASQLGAPASPLEVTTGAERSRLIVNRVATIEEEAYPEVAGRSRAQGDGWESALAALDDRVEDNLMAGREERARRRAVVPRLRRAAAVRTTVEPRVFSDAIGAVDTIDEPDGLEQDTQFLNFRAPGNHPEVRDTGSYINYLIEDEFKRNPSVQVRRKARSYLRVHEGGQNTRAQEAI